MAKLPKIDTRKLSKEELAEAIEKNKKIYDEYLDKEFVITLIDNVLSIIDETYFRSVFIGFRELPERNNPDHPLIYASNHSGMAFPWDAMVFSGGLLKKHGYNWKNSVRPLTAPQLSEITLMNPFLMKNVWKRCGGIDATSLNFETMMQYKDAELLIYPEGIAGIGKGFNHKYELQRFSTSMLRMSLKYKTDIIPFSTINGEYINPYVFSIKWVNKLSAKIGIPYIPIGLVTPFILVQPWIFYMAFPAKLYYVMGERIKPYEMIDKPFDEVTREDLLELSQKVHDEMQAQTDEAEEKWGKDPYLLREFWKRFGKNFKRFPFNMPFGWPLIFTEYERQFERYLKTGEKVNLKLGPFSTIRMLFRNPIVFCYFIPILGWIPLLIKGYRNTRE